MYWFTYINEIQPGCLKKAAHHDPGPTDIGPVWNRLCSDYERKKQNNPAKRFDYQLAYLEH
jgi:hypothetical protein